METKKFDVIIIGASYSGLAAGMALGRALKRVLIIDSGKPCNMQTPHSHNFLTQDGKSPAEITVLGKRQVQQYHTVSFVDDLATDAKKTEDGFDVIVATGTRYRGSKIIFATGIKDMMPDINGFAECWGISVLHCPYCHGYEVRNAKTGILGNGDSGFDVVKLISNWTNDLTLFTNGASQLSEEQTDKLIIHQIDIVEKEISHLAHTNGYVENIHFKDGSSAPIRAIYAPRPFQQHTNLPQALGCELTDEGYLKVDASHETTISEIFACGDNASRMRTVANAVAMGTAVGIQVSKRMIVQQF